MAHSADGPSLRERYRGCLLGQAVGDALGAPLEFQRREEIRREYPEGLRELIGGGVFGWRPGQYTDDTEMTVCLARSIVEQGGFDPQAAAEAFLAWYRSGPLDVGSLVSRALGLMDAGESWERAGRLAWEESEGRAAGNGGLMRCAPLALLHRENPAALVRDSRVSSAITHYDPRSQEATAAFNLALACALRGGTQAEMLAAARGAVEHPALVAALDAAPNLLEEQVPNGGYVVETLQACLWAFLSASDFEAAVVRAANLGGDADTIAALAGALAGAYYGEVAIPRRWLDVLERRAELEALADELLTLSTRDGR